MRRSFKIAGLCISGLLVLTQFTNCDVYSENSAFNSSSFDCEGNDCYVSNENALELTTVPSVLIVGSQLFINMGGFCNEAAFPNNAVVWDIVHGGVAIRSCNPAAGGDCSVCVNGRFSATVDLRPPLVLGNDMVLRFEIFGYDKTGKMYSNPLLARKNVQVIL